MPRLKSDDKREAILSASIRVFAERGLAAPTSAISFEAGIAEGSLFTYFPTKNDLINALYRDIKLCLAAALMSGVARQPTVRGRLRHIWDAYIRWGIDHANQRAVLAMLQLSGRLTDETRAVGSAPFAEIQAMTRQAVTDRIIRDLPPEVFTAALESLAAATMNLITARPPKARQYSSMGFEIFWRGIRMPHRIHES